MNIPYRRQRTLVQISLAATLAGGASIAAEVPVLPAGAPRLVTQPYLQNPTEDSVVVAWVTNFEGRKHRVVIASSRGKHRGECIPKVADLKGGKDHKHHDVLAKWGDKPRHDECTTQAHTMQLDRLFEDRNSKFDQPPALVSRRVLYRHEANVKGLRANAAYEYWVESVAPDGSTLSAGPYRLQPAPSPGRSLQILLTSDQQERFNTLANYQKVEEMFPGLDAIFFAGDLANIPRRGSEWFDSCRSSWHQTPTSSNPPFFTALQGTFDQLVPETAYRGGELLQNVPLFPSIANHEVDGRFRPNEQYLLNGNVQQATLNTMFNDPQPRWYAEHRYRQLRKQINPTGDRRIKEQWIRDNSNDFEVYRDLFTLPDDGPEGESYYAKRFGDVLLISLNVSRIWRNWSIGPNDRSKFIEMLAESNNPEEWGFGEHIFTPFDRGSEQYRWLKQVLNSKDFERSKYRVVMFHQSAFGLGDNAVPVLTDPVLHVQYRNEKGVSETMRVNMPRDNRERGEIFATQVEPLLGRLEQVRYEYPLDDDYFRRDIEPLLQKHDVQLVLVGHSHIWNRTQVGRMNMLETSSVGNCFGSFWTRPDGTNWRDAVRAGAAHPFWAEVDSGTSRWDGKNYARTDDPHGREPIMPNLANPMMLFEGSTEKLPFVCSNNISTFSILDTGKGVVSSYAFDVRDLASKVIEFDRFSL